MAIGQCLRITRSKQLVTIENGVRTIAVARITMPNARVRLSAGRQELGKAVQAMCFQAGANSIFYGDQLLTTGNPEALADRQLLAELGLKTKESCKAEVQV